MPYTLKVNTPEKITVQETGEMMLSVPFDVLLDGEVVTSMRHGFPLDITPEDLTLELGQVLTSYSSDKENEVRNADLEAALAQSDATVEEITGLEITPESVKAAEENQAKEEDMQPQEVSAEEIKSE